jgi:hypothetical protein
VDAAPTEFAIQAAANAGDPRLFLDRDINFIYDTDVTLHFYPNKSLLKTRISVKLVVEPVGQCR